METATSGYYEQSKIWQNWTFFSPSALNWSVNDEELWYDPNFSKMILKKHEKKKQKKQKKHKMLKKRPFMWKRSN